MKCPNCHEEMEKGVIGEGSLWIGWHSFLGFFSRSPLGTRIIAWKCPKCKKIELQAEK